MLIFVKAQTQNQPDLTELSRLFNEIDLAIPNNTYINTFVDEGALYSLEVLHLPKRLQDHVLNKILIFADSTLYASCEYRIRRYAYDIYNVYGCEIKMVVIKGENCVDVKNLILNDATDLDGTVFIGDIASASYEGTDVFRDRVYSWLCDMYYMDLDATWNDSDHDGIFDNYNDDFNPEIFVGRICAKNVGNGSDELELFEKYMDKNHMFWIGHREVNKKHGLSYTNATWNGSTDLISGIKYLYNSIMNCDTITSSDPDFCVQDYLNRLTDDNYEFIQLASHSNSFEHIFDSLVPIGPNLYDTLRVHIHNSTIYDNGVNAIGMNLYCCQACRWDCNGYIGGGYVYGPNSHVLTLIGSTKTGSMLDMQNFYTPLSNGETMGQAFVDWWRNGYSIYDMTSIQKISWYFGLTIVGDPLVNFFHCTNSTCQDIITLTTYDNTNSPLSYYLASEKIQIPSSASFVIPVKDHCILNAPTVEIQGEFFCPGNSTLEILNEGCQDNCDEE
jgi:hypothetical protein